MQMLHVGHNYGNSILKAATSIQLSLLSSSRAGGGLVFQGLMKTSFFLLRLWRHEKETTIIFCKQYLADHNLTIIYLPYSYTIWARTMLRIGVSIVFYVNSTMTLFLLVPQNWMNQEMVS